MTTLDQLKAEGKTLFDSLEAPIRTASWENQHTHWRTKQARKQKQKREFALVTLAAGWQRDLPPFPVTVLLTRISRDELDNVDNLASAFKYIRDELCRTWRLFVTDEHADPSHPERWTVADSDGRVTWEYAHEAPGEEHPRGYQGIRIDLLLPAPPDVTGDYRYPGVATAARGVVDAYRKSGAGAPDLPDMIEALSGSLGDRQPGPRFHADAQDPRSETVGRLSGDVGPHGLPSVWLTWVQRRNALVELRAVSISRKHRISALRCVRDEQEAGEGPMPVVRHWVEEIEADHFFAQEEMLAAAKLVEPRCKVWRESNDRTGGGTGDAT